MNVILEDYLVLIVDDNPTNLRVLVDYLSAYDLEIITAMDGEEALEVVDEEQIDLIVLDVMMPRLTGFEVCQRLKANEATKDIPVIFMTALASEDDKVKGFDVGAVDYVTKPIQQREVLARVTTHLRIQAQTRQLQQQAEKLASQTNQLQAQAEELQAKNNELAETNASKDRFFSIIAHDLKGPFIPLLGNTERLAKIGQTYSPEQVEEMGQSLHRTATCMFNLLETLLQWARIQMGRMEYQPGRLNLTEIIDQTINLLADVALNKQITLENRLQIPIYLNVDENMLKTIIRNLMSNALKFTPHSGQVSISAQKHETQSQKREFVELWVSDTGVGISQPDINRLFKINEYHTTLGTDDEKGTGLGLIMCYEMVERHGGRIWVESDVGQGTTFKATLPADGELPEGDWLSSMNGAKSSTEVLNVHVSAFIVPPKEKLTELYLLAKRGSMRKMQQWIVQVAETDEQYRPFTDHIDTLAQAFDSKGILTLVKSYL
ncbi:hybrid sensor histidine kinase/response regulator [Anaerolineales bacterium HSG25]|nr:hybrid sensor histidine kinase/response regulator [Anaerolineales bacterium HSG25]